MTGGANRERVLAAIAEGLANATVDDAYGDPEPILRSLEIYGYAVVREGQVPTPEPFASAADRLTGIARLLNEDAPLVTPRAGDRPALAAGVLNQYRQLACLVLDVDEDDID